MFSMHVINVAVEFSPEPAGRFITDGPTSGERFRNEILIPSLLKEDQLCVDLDELEGYGSSFLEESFGGVVRYGHFTADQLHSKLTISCEDDAIIQEIWSYIDDAEFNIENTRN
jgi:hypothetical protein